MGRCMDKSCSEQEWAAKVWALYESCTSWIIMSSAPDMYQGIPVDAVGAMKTIKQLCNEIRSVLVLLHLLSRAPSFLSTRAM